MTLAQVQATVALVTFLIVTWAGLIIAIALLLPKHTSRAELTLSISPLRCLWVGLVMLVPMLITLRMIALPSPAIKLIGFIALVAIGAALSIGSSGLAMLMGRRISEMTGIRLAFGSLVKGSVIYSLALGFPFIGWFLFLPISIVMSLGAGARALWRSAQTMYPANPSGPEYDVLEHRGAI
jgi:hypothetical protein